MWLSVLLHGAAGKSERRSRILLCILFKRIKVVYTHSFYRFVTKFILKDLISNINKPNNDKTKSAHGFGISSSIINEMKIMMHDTSRPVVAEEVVPPSCNNQNNKFFTK